MGNILIRNATFDSPTGTATARLTMMSTRLPLGLSTPSAQPSPFGRVGVIGGQTPETGSGEKGPSMMSFSRNAHREPPIRSVFREGYTEDYFSADNLGFAKYYGVIGTITHQLAQRASLNLFGRYQRPEYNDGQIDNLSMGGGGISYQLFRWLTLGLNLSYAQNSRR